MEGEGEGVGAGQRNTRSREDRLFGREGLAYFALFLVLGAVVAYLNRHHLEQQSNFLEEYVRMADYYRGLATRTVLTYPMWGYSFVLLALPRYDLVAIPQVLLGTLAATLLFLELRREMPSPRHRVALTLLFIAAIPWYLLHSVKWPQSFAGSLVVLGLVALVRALRASSLVLGGVAGALLGLALYFRSEFLYLPLFLIVLVASSRLHPRMARFPIAPVAVSAVVAWVVLIPWAIHYHQETGRFSLTASQRGIVAFISLGQLPGNPWGVQYLDEDAYDWLTAQGITVPPQSDSGDRVLFDEFKRRVRSEPVAFAKKVAWNAAMTMAGGFYTGEIPLNEADNAQLATLRTRVRALIVPGAVAADSAGGDGISARATFAFGYWAAAKAIGALFVILAMCGLLWCAIRGFSSPLMLLLGGLIAYQLLLLLALATEPRYLNGLYLAMVPFVITLASTARSWLRRSAEPRARRSEHARSG